MAIYERHSRETLLYRYKETGLFAGDEIVNNSLDNVDLSGACFRDVRILHSSLNHGQIPRMTSERLYVDGSDFREINLSHSLQHSSTFLHTYLMKSDFSRSRLFDLTVSDCIVHGIDFRESHLVNAVFTDCEMFKAKFENSIAVNVTFKAVKKKDLAGLNKSRFIDSVFLDCDFSNMNMYESDFSGSLFIACDLRGALTEGAIADRGRFIGCRTGTGTGNDGYRPENAMFPGLSSFINTL
ncbi:MAG: pentapeptide repeat-containing protein [Spirochaetales bacterium]|nr:pentapeptide repeat-containing protein [Spirochaetales bacterium]